jgi:hypothetical protein
VVLQGSCAQLTGFPGRGIATIGKSRHSDHRLVFTAPRPWIVLASAAGFVVAAVWGVACGPSVQFIYEGNIRFEHCYRLDFDERIAPSHRRACWVEWSDQFSNGQTRDRLEYAKRRIEMLGAGDGAALSLHLEDPSDAGPSVGSSDPTPVPTTAHAPPPARIQPPAPSPSVGLEVEDKDAGNTLPASVEPDAANKGPKAPSNPAPKRRRQQRTRP